MAESFDKVRALVSVSNDEFDWDVPDGWQQGRGAFGGLVLATLLDAMRTREVDEARLPRAFMGELCGPTLATRARISTHILRRGNNQTNVTARLSQGHETIAQTSLTLAAARNVKNPPKLGMPSPVRPAWQDVAVAPIRAPLGPKFAEQYEFRVVSGIPFTGQVEPEITGYIRETVPLSRVTHGAIIGRLDSYYPAVFAMERGPRPIATVSFMAEFLEDPATLDPAVPLFYRARSIAQAGGYFVELRELWNGDTLVALNQQTFALLG